MPRAKTLAALVAAAGILAVSATAQAPAGFDGKAALDATRRVVAFGPRPPGSPAHAKLRRWLTGELRPLKCEVTEDSFTAQTPRGPLPMTNIIAKFPGTSGRVVVVSGHYETYARPGLDFVGANDGGSSTGLLLELARAIDRRPRRDSIWVVWFDGEEALVSWTPEDSLYGSRHLARKWRADGTIHSIAALINVDMIGDADLALVYELNSTPWLRDLVWSSAARLGYEAHFPKNRATAIEDDHLPFIQAGVPAVNLIDYDYGPGNAYWHTEHDTPDKLSARSFEVVGQVVLETIRLLEQRGGRR